MKPVKPRSLATFVALVLLGSLLGGSAAAYYRGGIRDCGGTTVNYYFVNTAYANWTADRKDAVRAGFREWQKVKSANGSRGATMNEVGSSTGSGINVAVKLKDLPGLYGTASGDCTEIAINSQYKNKLGILRATAAHEMGHMLGLAHADRNDDAQIPTMASCLTTSKQPVKGDIEPDDHAALIQRRSPDMHANQSFEAGVFAWEKTNLTYWASVTDSSVPAGQYALRFRRSRGGPAADRGVVSQNRRVINSGSFDAAAYIRKSSATAQGTVVLSLPWRAVVYINDPQCWGVRRTSDWMAGPRVNVSPTLTYTEYATSMVTPQCGTHVYCGSNSVLGAQMTVKLRNALYEPAGGDPPQAFTDLARARAR